MQVNSMNLDIFPIPIMIGTLGEESRELNRQLIEDSKRAFNEINTEQRSGVGVDQTISGLENYYESFRTLGVIISQCSKTRLQGSQEISTEGFWVNRNTNKSAFHMPHSHSFKKYMWTGVYFPTSGFINGKAISDNENLDEIADLKSSSQPSPGALTLLDPLEFAKSGICEPEIPRYPYWGNPIVIPPKEGTFVIFPTYLTHMVTPTNEDNFYRLSTAFYLCN